MTVCSTRVTVLTISPTHNCAYVVVFPKVFFFFFWCPDVLCCHDIFQNYDYDIVHIQPLVNTRDIVQYFWKLILGNAPECGVAVWETELHGDYNLICADEQSASEFKTELCKDDLSRVQFQSALLWENADQHYPFNYDISLTRFSQLLYTCWLLKPCLSLQDKSEGNCPDGRKQLSLGL